MNNSPADTLRFLVALDPRFEAEWKDFDDSGDELTHHRIVMTFAQYLGANHRSFSKNQLRTLGEWLSAAIAAGGELENAVSTCLLEHARQLKINRTLAPYLSTQAKTHV